MLGLLGKGDCGLVGQLALVAVVGSSSCSRAQWRAEGGVPGPLGAAPRPGRGGRMGRPGSGGSGALKPGLSVGTEGAGGLLLPLRAPP